MTAVRRVAVVGRDAAAWIAALSIHRAFGRAGVAVQVVELPSLLQPVDVYSAAPSIRAMHRLIGLDEAIVVHACDAVPMVAQRYANWSGPAPPFLHAFDSPPPPGGDIDFTQYWLKGRSEGLKVGFESFSLGATAAAQGRVPELPDGQEAALSAGFGWHLDARSYAGLLKQFARHNGIDSVGTISVAAERDGERIAAVALDDGRRIEADLFVDASGGEGVLVRSMPGAAFESWRRWLPADRMLAASAPRLKTLPAFSQLSAFRGGWIGLFPLRSRTAVVAAYDSAAVSDQDVAGGLSTIARVPVSGDAVVAPFEAGMLARPWIGNCVAVGDAAVALEPLDAAPLHLVHSCVSHLISLFPVAAESFPESEAYNRIVASLAGNVRDFQVAHYRLNRRFDEPLWDRLRESGVPASLERKLRLFAMRGIVPIYDDESFFEPNWSASLLGHGLTPEGYDPRIDVVPDDDHIAKVQGRLTEVAAMVRAMPTVDAFLEAAARRRPMEAAQ